LLQDEPGQVLEHYRIQFKSEPDRVAGRDCLVVVLIPLDQQRYGHILCVDVGSHLLLRAQTVAQQNDIIDQIAFVSLTVGEDAADDRVSPSWDTDKWDVDDVPMAAIDLDKKGWRIPTPPGFRIMTQVSRPLRADDFVNQMVL